MANLRSFWLDGLFIFSLFFSQFIYALKKFELITNYELVIFFFLFFFNVFLFKKREISCWNINNLFVKTLILYTILFALFFFGKAFLYQPNFFYLFYFLTIWISVILFFLINRQIPDKKVIGKVLFAIIAVNFLFIAYDFIQINFIDSGKQLLPNLFQDENYKVKFNYASRPLGLNLQPTVNGISLLFFLGFYKLTNSSHNALVHILAILGIIMTGSLAAILLLIVFLSSYLRKEFMIYSYLSIGVLLTVGFLFLLENSEFLNNVNDFYSVWQTEFINFFRILNNPLDAIFGVNWEIAAANFPENGLLKMGYQLGIPVMLLQLIIFLIVFLSLDKEYRLTFLLFIIGSLHYETIFRNTSIIFLLPLFLFLGVNKKICS